MGARISIKFTNKNDKSVVLCHHWGGEEFLDEVQKFLNQYTNQIKNNLQKNYSSPSSRMEPQMVMCQFIAWLSETKQLSESVYLGKDTSEVDDSDYGHHEIELFSLDSFS